MLYSIEQTQHNHEDEYNKCFIQKMKTDTKYCVIPLIQVSIRGKTTLQWQSQNKGNLWGESNDIMGTVGWPLGTGNILDLDLDDGYISVNVL